MAKYYAMCSTAAGLLHLRDIVEHFQINVNTTRCWSGNVESVGGEDVVVARSCARSRIAAQIETIEDEQSRPGDEGAFSAKISRTASRLWYRDS